MLTQNGQNAYFHNEEEEEFLNDIRLCGIPELINSMKMIHDLALYHSTLCLDNEEKTALFNLKILWQGLEQLEKS